MKAVIQRVKAASVKVNSETVSSIRAGILTLLGIEKGDDQSKVEKMVQKICELRIFSDDSGKMNLSLADIQGEHLIVSQFTLAGDCFSGRRPSFTSAEEPQQAKQLYEKALECSRSKGISTQAGIFQADMEVTIVNDGPVTFILEL